MSVYFRYYEACSDGEDKNRKSVLHFPPSSKPYLEKMTLKIGGGPPGAKDTGDIRLRFNPITCYAGNVYLLSKVFFFFTDIWVSMQANLYFGISSK